MKQYQPLLLPRRQYAEERAQSTFRQTIWEVVVTLNPRQNELLLPDHDPELNLRRHHYPLRPDQFRAEAGEQVVKAARAMTLVNQGIPILERIEPLRAKESSERWRAAYDLAYAQLICFRIRLFQYLLAMDKHANEAPKPGNEKSNEWNVNYTHKMLVPDDAQFDRLKKSLGIGQSKEEYLALLDDETKRATDLFDVVIRDHPGTPWARTAETEKRSGFGMEFREGYWDPRYYSVPVKIPNF